MEPFRVFLAIILVVFLAVWSWVMVLYKRICTQEITPEMARFPRRDIMTVALLDSVRLYIVIIAGAPTPPVLTVLLQQGQIPAMMLMSKLMRPPRNYLTQHWVGGLFMLLGIALPLAVTVYADRMGEMGTSSGCQGH
jgi:hypothetical protein